MNKRKLLHSFLLCLWVATISMGSCNQSSTERKATNAVAPADAGHDENGLDRHPTSIHYSKHAKCRMACRHIDETEVKDLLQSGAINYQKSDLRGDDCHKKYAVEGTSKDNQRLRIIFAPCRSEVTVVTCIDMGEEWSCHCEGDRN